MKRDGDLLDVGVERSCPVPTVEGGGLSGSRPTPVLTGSCVGGRAEGRVYPHVKQIRRVSLQVATAVAKAAIEEKK